MGMFVPPAEPDGESNDGQNENEQPPKAGAPARFTARAGKVKFGVARHAKIKP